LFTKCKFFPSACITPNLQCIIYPKVKFSNLIETIQLGCCTAAAEVRVNGDQLEKKTRANSG